MNKYIKIIRGDDTNFLNSCLLTISLTADISLVGFSAELRIGRYVFRFDDVTTPSQINITAEQSQKLPLGNINGTYTLFDTQNRRKIISTTIPFRVVTTVTSPVVIENYDVTVNVNYEDIENLINVNFTNNGGGTNDHNELINRDLPYQHPMSSITGLEETLEGKQDTLVAGTGIAINGNVITNTQTSAEGKTNSYVVSYINNPAFNTEADSFQLSGTFTDVTGVVHKISELKLGDTIYVQELDVPDRWCSQVNNDSVVLYKLETSKVTIPTKTSELENDSNFITQNVLDNTINPLNTSIGNINTKLNNTETWTFTLEDGTEVTKNIVVGS